MTATDIEIQKSGSESPATPDVSPETLVETVLSALGNGPTDRTLVSLVTSKGDGDRTALLAAVTLADRKSADYQARAALGVWHLVRTFGMTGQAVADEMGRSKSRVSQLLAEGTVWHSLGMTSSWPGKAIASKDVAALTQGGDSKHLKEVLAGKARDAKGKAIKSPTAIRAEVRRMAETRLAKLAEAKAPTGGAGQSRSAGGQSTSAAKGATAKGAGIVHDDDRLTGAVRAFGEAVLAFQAGLAVPAGKAGNGYLTGVRAEALLRTWQAVAPKLAERAKLAEGEREASRKAATATIAKAATEAKAKAAQAKAS